MRVRVYAEVDGQVAVSSRRDAVPDTGTGVAQPAPEPAVRPARRREGRMVWFSWCVGDCAASGRTEVRAAAPMCGLAGGAPLTVPGLALPDGVPGTGKVLTAAKIGHK